MIILLSTSATGLQKLLDISVLIGNELCLQFNDKNSHCMEIGPKYNSRPAPMFLLSNPVEWVDSVKYIGVTIIASKNFIIDINQIR